jgi:uncharacterized delta-60 repeat protein
MRVLVLAAALGLSLASNAAAAQPGALDRTFGGDGRVETRLRGGAAQVAGVAVGPQGRILVGGTAGDGRVVLVRYRRDGRLDRGFGSGGIAEVVFPDGVGLHDMVVDASGRVLLGGSVGRGALRDAAVLRLLPSGALDPEFGANGIFRIDLGGAAGDFVSGLAVQGERGIVAAVSVEHGQPSTSSWNDLAVLRLHGEGALDPGFGEQGLTRLAGTWTTPYWPAAVAIEPDAHVLVGVVAGYTPKLAVASSVLRLTPDGAIDTPFGGSQTGMLHFSLPGEERVRDIAFDASAGRVMVAGSVFEEDGHTRPFAGALTGVVPEGYGAGNVLSFGEGGGRMLDGLEGIAEALVLDRRGSALIAGGAFGPSWKRSDLLVARVDRSGRLDRGFASEGLRRVRFPGRAALGAALVLQPDGRIVAAGPAGWEGQHPRSPTLQLVRLHGGYDERAPRLSLRVVRRDCAAGVLRLRVTARDASALRSLVVMLGDRRLAATRRGRLTIRLSARAAGRRVRVVAADVAGNRATRSRLLGPCR